MGSLMSFLLQSSQTQNGFYLLEYRSRPGHEPPPHLHLDQDETFYLLEGELEVYCMGQVRTVRAGQALFLPRNQAHAWYVTSPTVRVLVMTNPGGLDGYFEAMSNPATGMELPGRHQVGCYLGQPRGTRPPGDQAAGQSQPTFPFVLGRLVHPWPITRSSP